MKLKIKYRLIDPELSVPEIIDKGDWIDLRARHGVRMIGPLATRAKKDENRKVTFNSALVPLNVAMQLPKGFEAVVNPRSSMYKTYGVILANSQGVIDNSFCGDTDEWKANLIAMQDVAIEKGDKIVQFRIQLSQKATVWQKLKWLFCNGVKLVNVDELNHPDRGGYGTTGVK